MTLTKQHLTYCDKLARQRQESAERNARPGTNGAPDRGPLALHNHVQGARGECAAYLWLGLAKTDWHRFQEHGLSGLPDLSDFIDVKTVHGPTHRLMVQKKAPDEWAYLLVNSARHPQYALMGWVWGHEAKLPENWKDPVGGRAAFFVQASALRPPASLKAELRRRTID